MALQEKEEKRNRKWGKEEEKEGMEAGYPEP